MIDAQFSSGWIQEIHQVLLPILLLLFPLALKHKLDEEGAHAQSFYLNIPSR